MKVYSSNSMSHAVNMEGGWVYRDAFVVIMAESSGVKKVLILAHVSMVSPGTMKIRVGRNLENHILSLKSSIGKGHTIFIHSPFTKASYMTLPNFTRGKSINV